MTALQGNSNRMLNNNNVASGGLEQLNGMRNCAYSDGLDLLLVYFSL